MDYVSPPEVIVDVEYSTDEKLMQTIFVDGRILSFLILYLCKSDHQDVSSEIHMHTDAKTQTVSSELFNEGTAH